MTFELIAVPARGTEDVVVATHGRDESAVREHDGVVWLVSLHEAAVATARL